MAQDQEDLHMQEEHIAAAIAPPMEQAPQHGGSNGNGKLEGTPPTPFEGDRSKAQDFLKEFHLYRNINNEAKSMVEPFKRVSVALTRIRGPLVNDWVMDQLEKLELRRTLRGPNNEYLWDEFVREFKTAYTNTTERQDAHVKLKSLRMSPGDLDGYVATFKQLARKAGYDLDAEGTLDVFQGGLPRGLWEAILRRDNTPNTFEEWTEAAQKEQQKYMIIRSRPNALGYKSMNANQKQAVWRQAFNLPPKKSHHQTYKQRDPNAMDVDTVEVNQVSTSANPRIQKARAEGRCYFCNQQGHIKRNCPKLPQQPQKQANEGGTSKAFDYKAFGDHIRSLDLEEKEEAVGEFLSRLDFQ